MATSSFNQNFYVAPENIDAFISVVTAPLPESTGEVFKSRAISAEEARERVERALAKNGKAHSPAAG